VGNKQTGGPGLFHKLPHFRADLRFQLRVKADQGFVQEEEFGPGGPGPGGPLLLSAAEFICSPLYASMKIDFRA
jgi:hypothetical protein